MSAPAAAAKRQWLVAQCDDVLAARLADECGLPPVVGRILVNRGIATAAEARKFLEPSLSDLHDPYLLPDLEAGVDTVAAAMEAGEKIWVYGDYDVDGVTSTALLIRTLRALKADVDYRLPHRQKDGYGIKPGVLEEAARNGVKVVLTCDCGIGACDTAQRAKELGVELVITDHHEPGAELPQAGAVIDPKRTDSEYPFPELAGVGVAFKFAQALVGKLGYNEESFQRRFLDLTAFGTVGDVVPLVGENRAIVKHGMAAISSSKKLGLQTMLEATNLIGKPMSAYYLGFVLGPRINAVGRLDDASAAVDLLLTRDRGEAAELAQMLEQLNSERRTEQDRILQQAIEQVESRNLNDLRALVLSSEDWNPGIIGIVASKICDLYNRPTVMVARDESEGIGRGSGRSIDAFNLLEGLRACDDLLSGYGGHCLAAGVSIPLENIEAFERRLSDRVFERVSEEDMIPHITADAELDASQITWDLARAIASIEPFGTGNPEPVFISRGLTVDRKDRVGSGAHLKLRVRSEGSDAVECIGFGMGEICDSMELGGTIDLCYSIRLNTFRGNESIQLNLNEVSTP